MIVTEPLIRLSQEESWFLSIKQSILLADWHQSPCRKPDLTVREKRYLKVTNSSPEQTLDFCHTFIQQTALSLKVRLKALVFFTAAAFLFSLVQNEELKGGSTLTTAASRSNQTCQTKQTCHLDNHPQGGELLRFLSLGQFCLLRVLYRNAASAVECLD